MPEPDYIKIDVEGAEAKVLEGARNLLFRRHPTLFLEMHQWLQQYASSHDDCWRFLTMMGYDLKQEARALDSDYHIFASKGKPARWHAAAAN